ncbi:LysR family transcriptional regulator [Erysipelothrix sp. HDW6C]|uniref:LysR family transcriptional regulator n=1 Tax=Erysipelothrix sp. HDW6C TaxID=2714930 RepID=UPI00140E21AD|nr:LysR family transcriptional regulator [Erysipelothrix sp. HDW6C]QIK69572.1 LysR family transcriptional regulator [Erysipelothrix sp. HDW6C]
MQNTREMKRLYTFKAVYELNSFSRAAEIMFITQAAVSIQIQQLEEEVEAIFFQRNGRNSIIPTEAGRLFYKQVIKMIDEWQNTMTLLNEVSNIRNRCTIGCSHSFSNTYLPSLVVQLIKQFPAVDFKFSVDNSQVVYDGVMKRTIDFGVIERALPIEESLERIQLVADSLVLAGNPDGKQWIMREQDSGIHYYNKMFLDEEGITPRLLSQ